MKILVACEFSGIVWKAFTDKGHDVTSCDLLPSELSTKHYQGDVINILYQDWDIIIAFPPCTYLCHSGVRWFYPPEGVNSPNAQDRFEKMINACDFFRLFLDHPCQKICIENPVPHGMARLYIGRYNQLIQPSQFGHPEKKRTCLWLKGLPHLTPTNDVREIMQNLPVKEQNRIHLVGPRHDRQKERSRFFHGIAEAMANQWGTLGGVK